MAVNEKKYFTCLMKKVVVKGFLPLEIEALSVSEDPLSCELEIKRNIVEQVMKCKYLGTGTTRNGALQSEVQRVAQKAGRISRPVNYSIFWDT
jgi:hypothetical protein